jgi:hypothetical protein
MVAREFSGVRTRPEQYGHPDPLALFPVNASHSCPFSKHFHQTFFFELMAIFSGEMWTFFS